ncbi:hypothetical protein VCRA2116O29_270070 [Vibrio crassostreae]|nr:hypothetical protein VCRA2116O29_270070 [Vibrio crassostreae]CAK2485155.1 hypothetical protein VCRA2119O48_390011 [Vibrio crassostreae]CAK2987500.1 hypothetical protein VCRA2133E348_480009 [Vibrio crassostreae]CAK3151140.1 hypothetical protein VCRA213O314_120106 [Vibrio crassostreae]CAK3733025.1 hypothetical protein VCRA2123O74_250070 [Vibrio crassostreae]
MELLVLRETTFGNGCRLFDKDELDLISVVSNTDVHKNDFSCQLSTVVH